MQRIYVPLVLLAIVALVIVGCGGGGGGDDDNGGDNGGGGGTVGTTALSGRVIGTDGNALSGATVTVTVSGRSPINATTNGEGEYTMSNVLTNTDFTLTVTASGISARTWTSMRINTTNMPSGSRMHIALAPSLEAGSTLNITPNISSIAPNDTPYFRARVTDQAGFTVMDYYPVVWTVVGNIPSQLPAGGEHLGRYLYLLGEPAGAKARVTATALIGTTPTSRTIEVTVRDTSSDPVEPPPPPPAPG